MLLAWALSRSPASDTLDGILGATLLMKFKPRRSALPRNLARPFGQFKEEKEVDKQSLPGHSISGDDDVIE